MVALVAFATFIFMDDKNNLDPNTAFVSLALFNMLRQPLNFIPRIIQGLTQVSIFELDNKFLKLIFEKYFYLKS